MEMIPDVSQKSRKKVVARKIMVEIFDDCLKFRVCPVCSEDLKRSSVHMANRYKFTCNSCGFIWE